MRRMFPETGNIIEGSGLVFKIRKESKMPALLLRASFSGYEDGRH